MHIVITSGGLPVELQIRTYLQDRWANETEGLADAWGRGIRYGLPPEGPDADEVRRRSQVIEANNAISDLMFDWESTVDRLRSELAGEFVGRNVSREEVGARARERLANELAPVQDRLIAALADFRQLRDAVG